MKTQLIWSGTVLFGIVGLLVWRNGGWGSATIPFKPLTLVKTVWVTNEVSKGNAPARSGWDEPLKPIDQSHPEMFIPWEGHRIPNPHYFTHPIATNFLFDHNTLLKAITPDTNDAPWTNCFVIFTNAIMYSTNLYFVNPGITNYFR